MAALQNARVLGSALERSRQLSTDRSRAAGEPVPFLDHLVAILLHARNPRAQHTEALLVGHDVHVYRQDLFDLDLPVADVVEKAATPPLEFLAAVSTSASI